MDAKARNQLPGVFRKRSEKAKRLSQEQIEERAPLEVRSRREDGTLADVVCKQFATRVVNAGTVDALLSYDLQIDGQRYVLTNLVRVSSS